MTRIEKEKNIVSRMIRLYCRKEEENRQLCEDCKVLEEYAHARLEHCPFGEEKTSCKHCVIHCYKPEMREKMKKVMRFAGPRMLFYHPWATLEHLFRF